MTDLPAWVEAALTVDGLSYYGEHISPTPSLCSLVSPLSSKETCLHAHRCEIQINRILSALIAFENARWCNAPREKYWRGYPYLSRSGEVLLWEGPTFYCSRCSLICWDRCTECEKEKRRWLRAKSLAFDLTAVSRFLKKSIRFVTLTIPNISDPVEGVIRMKKMVKDFRRRVGFKAHVVGGSDFYEWTETENGFNVHHHGLWIGDYYEQGLLTEEWGNGHVWITAIRRGKKGTQKMVSYAVKYTTKQAELGIRSRQRFGCLYGRAFAELESLVRPKDGL
jgi:hypothetical protein